MLWVSFWSGSIAECVPVEGGIYFAMSSQLCGYYSRAVSNKWNTICTVETSNVLFLMRERLINQISLNKAGLYTYPDVMQSHLLGNDSYSSSLYSTATIYIIVLKYIVFVLHHKTLQIGNFLALRNLHPYPTKIEIKRNSLKSLHFHAHADALAPL